MAAKTTKTTRTNWKELYQDLPENIAAVLREKRVKPEQLTAKADGTILALGLSDTDLETIRAKYPSTLADAEKKETKVETKPAAVKSDSHFYKYPRRVEFVETLPRTETGKLQHFKLRELAPVRAGA